MDKPETLVTLDTQDTGRRQTRDTGNEVHRLYHLTFVYIHYNSNYVLLSYLAIFAHMCQTSLFCFFSSCSYSAYAFVFR